MARTIGLVGLVLREDGPQTRPVFLCHYCGGEINEAENGMFYWDIEGSTPAYSAHKSCDVAAGLPTRMSMGLSTELIYLLRNSGMDEADLEHEAETANIMARL